jgi:hypothetical protein
MAEEYCWAITQARGGHAAADQVPVCWIWISIGLPCMYMIRSDLRKIRLVPHPPERNCWVSWGVCIAQSTSITASSSQSCGISVFL